MQILSCEAKVASDALWLRIALNIHGFLIVGENGKLLSVDKEIGGTGQILALDNHEERIGLHVHRNVSDNGPRLADEARRPHSPLR
jgi:hypothetical protein